MNKYPNLIVLVLLMMLPLLGFAQKPQTVSQKIQNNRRIITSDKDSTKSKKYVPGKLDVIYIEENSDWGISNNFFDSSDEDDGTESESDILYASFDTCAIHYPKFDFSQKADTTYLILARNKKGMEYIHPYKGKVSSHFGPRKRRYHYGIDISLKTGDSVVSAFEGIVRIAKLNRTYGNLVVIRHENGLETFYAHLSAIEVNPGQKVSAGELIGLGGNTGRSRGSHLHFELRYLGAAIDPEKVVNFNKFALLSDTLALTKDYFQHQAERSSSKMLASSSSRSAKSKGKASSGGSKYYTIKKGDTLGAIASRNKTSVNEICRMNKIKKTNVLAVGSKIKIR